MVAKTKEMSMTTLPFRLSGVSWSSPTGSDRGV